MAEVIVTEDVSTSSSGPNTEWGPTEPGVYCAQVTFDTAPDSGDTIDVFWYLTLSEGEPRRVGWSITVDSSTDVTQAFQSPPIPLTDLVYDEFRSSATVTGTIAWRYRIIKVADLEVS